MTLRDCANVGADSGMHRYWTDNRPGWQQRLDADLDAVGLREAERRLATDFYDREYRATVEAWIQRQKAKKAT
jgi:hypothetical protein